MDIKKILIEEGLYEFITSIKSEKEREVILNECKIKSFKSRDSLYFGLGEDDTTLIFLDGKISLQMYIGESSEYTIMGNKDLWIGLLEALDIDKREFEVSFLEDTTVLYFPLKKLLYSDSEKRLELWIKISKLIASKYSKRLIKNARRNALTTESYFLTSLVENGYKYVDVSLEELSYELDIQNRTLQRIINKLENLGIIQRDKKNRSIYSVSKEKVDNYMLE